MKTFYLTVYLGLLASIVAFAQEIAPAPEGKAVVYFVRPSALGMAINFSYFDSTTLIGRFNGPKYIRYECEPGKHLFWARSENRDFVEAEIEPGKIYFIEAIVKMGAVKAAVNLQPVDPADKKRMDKIMKLLAKRPSESFTPEKLKEDLNSLEDAVDRGIEKYKEDKTNGKTFAQLVASMNYAK